MGFRDNLFHLQAKGWLLKTRKETLMIRNQRGFTKKRDGLPVTLVFLGVGEHGILKLGAHGIAVGSTAGSSWCY